jgi:hypothetical protein
MVFKIEELLLASKACGNQKKGAKEGVDSRLLPPELLDFEPRRPAAVIRTHSRTLDDPGGNRPKLVTSHFESNRRRH